MKDLPTILRARELTGGVSSESHGDIDIVWTPYTGEVYTVTYADAPCYVPVVWISAEEARERYTLL